MTAKPTKTFVLALPSAPERVAAWCRPLGTLEDGAEKFECLNGGWRGTYKDGQVYVEGFEDLTPGVKIWEGIVPDTHSDDYNEAIMWIEQQIRARDQ